MRIPSLVAALCLITPLAAQAGITDTVQSPSGYFVDNDANKYSSPYYRWYGDDWGWTHSSIAGSITSASLNISAFDVDAYGTSCYSYCEVDKIYAYDDGVKTLLGTLAGATDIWAFTTFSLGSNFFNDINSGLQVWMEIDSGDDGWAVTLAKSSLSVDGGTLPPPSPNPVPEPETYAMLLAGLGLLGILRRRQRNRTVA